ncbi:hypothetical protein BY458DRAFT_504986 [Sporodiniella umbellata]|nr:hypothetical protein BY458DRAFT_504986 [Sporodiniella umbellata]
MKCSAVLALLGIGINYVTEAAILNSRTLASCGYLSKKIFCFGGDLSRSTSVYDLDTALYSLDINQYRDDDTSSLNNKWTLVHTTNSFSPEFRRAPQFVTLPNENSFLIVGGLMQSYSWHGVLVNQSILYNTVNNTWESVPQYSEPDRKRRQIYFGTAVNIPSPTSDTVGFYGGHEAEPDLTIPMVSVTHQTIPVPYDNSTSNRGFDSFTVYNLSSKQWSYFSPQKNIPVDFYPYSLTGTLNPATGLIYYMGGDYFSVNGGGMNHLAFNQARVFDTRQGQWGMAQLGSAPSSRIPSSRMYHTATMLPNSQHILLYGGTSDESLAVTDFIYTLDLTTNNWTEQTNVNVPTSVTQSGARFGHSAVLVDKVLFILFGRDINGNASPNLLTFSVGNISNIEYAYTYPPMDLSMDELDDRSLSTGAKAGIAVGIVVVVIAMIAGFVFLFRRNKREHSELKEDDVVYVDWDAIENQYREQVPPSYVAFPGQINSPSRQTPDVYQIGTLDKNKPHSPSIPSDKPHTQY